MKKNRGLITIIMVFIMLATIIAAGIFFLTRLKKEQKGNVDEVGAYSEESN